jgi:hypothetical protein
MTTAVKVWIAIAAAACVTGCANGSSGLSSPSPLAVATPSLPSSCAVPGAPHSLFAEVIGGSVSLSWSPVSAATDYIVVLSGTSSSAETLLINASGAHHSIDAFPPGTHLARVHAHNWCGSSEASEPVEFTVGS